MVHDVFVCHSSKDRTLANAIVATLEEHGVRCWIAPRDVVPGLEYAESIIEAIEGSGLTVLVFSANANASPHVRRELERTASHGIPILPFRVEDVLPAPSVEYFISDAHWLDAMTPPLEQHLDHLVGTVRLLLDRQAAQVGSQADPSAGRVRTSALADSESRATWTPPPAADGPGPPAAEIGSGSRRGGRGLLYAALAAVLLVGIVIAVVLALGSSDAPGGAAADDPVAGQQSTPSGGAEPDAPVIVEFDDGLGEGWTWENEDPQAWAVEDGALRIEVADSPPLRNVLLRDLPRGDAVIQVRLEFDPSAPGNAAGLALVGDEVDDRVELCWTTEGLFIRTVKNGVIVEAYDLAAAEFQPGEWIGAELSFEIVGGEYTSRFQSAVTPNWLVHTAPLPAGTQRVALLAYATTEGGTETARFTRFVLQ